jgi:hypothetical protein
MNLAQTYKDYKDHYRLEHANEQIRNRMKDNISGNRKYHRDIGCALSAILNRKVLRKQFALQFSQAVKDQDHDQAIDLINDYEYRTIRSTMNEVVEVFDNKFNDYYFGICEDCGFIEIDSNFNNAYDGDRMVCNSCFEEYYYHDHTGQYVHQDDENYSSDDDDNDSIIGEYHSSSDNLGKIPSLFDKRKSQIFLGLELEIEVNEDYSRSDKAEMILSNIGTYIDDKNNRYTYCLAEDDGSLNYGFELVTGYTGLDVHEKQLAYFKKPIRGLRSHDTSTCGLHIHIDKRHVTLNHATKMILFMNDSGNQKLIKTIARRSSNRFCKVLNKKADYSWLKSAKRSHDPLCNLNEDRYECLNFQNDKTIEFRLFKGTLKFESIMACLEFTYATWFFCKDNGYQDLNSDNFIKFICNPQNRSDTKYLRAYLKSHLFDIPEVDKPNPRIESNQLVTAEI